MWIWTTSCHFWVVSYRWGIIPITKDLTLIFEYTWYQYQKKNTPFHFWVVPFGLYHPNIWGDEHLAILLFTRVPEIRPVTAIFARNLSPCGFCLIPHLQWFISLLYSNPSEVQIPIVGHGIFWINPRAWFCEGSVAYSLPAHLFLTRSINMCFQWYPQCRWNPCFPMLKPSVNPCIAIIFSMIMPKICFAALNFPINPHEIQWNSHELNRAVKTPSPWLRAVVLSFRGAADHQVHLGTSWV